MDLNRLNPDRNVQKPHFNPSRLLGTKEYYCFLKTPWVRPGGRQGLHTGLHTEPWRLGPRSCTAANRAPARGPRRWVPPARWCLRTKIRFCRTTINAMAAMAPRGTTKVKLNSLWLTNVSGILIVLSSIGLFRARILLGAQWCKNKYLFKKIQIYDFGVWAQRRVKLNIFFKKFWNFWTISSDLYQCDKRPGLHFCSLCSKVRKVGVINFGPNFVGKRALIDNCIFSLQFQRFS